MEENYEFQGPPSCCSVNGVHRIGARSNSNFRTVKCARPDTSQSVEVGDQPGHVLVVEKGSCTWSVPLELTGLKSQRWPALISVDVMVSKFQARGYDLITMDNGDKAYVHFQGMANIRGEAERARGPSQGEPAS